MTAEELQKPTTPVEQASILDFVNIASKPEYTNILRRILFELEQLKRLCAKPKA
jgi:hypothetical protein